MTTTAYSSITPNTTSIADSMTGVQIYSTFKSYVLRLHDGYHSRRNKKTKPRLVISAPFDFKKEDSMSILPDTFGEELYMLREKAAASIVGSAVSSIYEKYTDSVSLAASPIPNDYGNKAWPHKMRAALLGVLFAYGPPHDGSPDDANFVSTQRK
ncbi:hypothetical protein SEPCBS119000_001095 [Sporothrix epigloea]|uniref:Uncharacterized protein n=1 Tax=Sporothrix epigloea TaxID=1892477 RepID=A0ABP0D9V2_9PEZI